MKPLPPIVLLGPTASGKTALAIELAGRLGPEVINAEVINADSVQLYRGMDIGSAKAAPAERRGVPHHLIDVLDVTQEASVAAFQTAARAAIAEIGGRGRVPLLVGGSSLYVRAVIDRLEFPGTDPAVRSRWETELRRLGPQALHAELGRRDPRAAAAILPSNGRRLVRALEVVELTGSFTAELPPFEAVFPGTVLLGLDVPREVLDRRIEERVDRMWADGLVEEVRALAEAGLASGPTAARALGYSQVLAMLAGDLSEEQARDETVRGTRRFARRQDRMFRKDPRIHWLAFDDPRLVDRALAVATRG